MAQLLFYVECSSFDENGRLIDVHESQAGGLPILYKNEKKARFRASLIRQRYYRMGYRSLGDNPLPPYHLLNDNTGLRVQVCIREVYVKT